MEEIIVHEKKYEIIKLLGHGKEGYSYLAKCDRKFVVLKRIHHEPCSYYTFGNKILAEKNDYERLNATGIKIPKLYDIDIENEIVIKEYIDGKTIFEMVKEDIDVTPYIKQVKEMTKVLFEFGLNIDYFPTNFVVSDGIMYYIDYECNTYMEEWNFENWGIKYWSKTKEFQDYLDGHK